MVNALQQLSGVNRFSMLSAMLPRSDKAVVKETLEALTNAGADAEVMQGIATKYRV